MANPFGDGIPIPDVIDPPDSMSMTLCIPKNRDHMSAFFGALYQLTVWNSWQQDGTQHGKELAAVWWRYYLSWNRTMSDIECEDGMSECCEDKPRRYRINPDTGSMEQSNNGGATWGAAAGGFQSVIVEPVPPVTSGVAATKCDAATNVRDQVNEWITHVSDDFDTATSLLEFGIAVIAAIAGAVLTIITEGGFAPIEAQLLAALGAAFIAVWGAGKAAFDTYWTTENKDKVFCAAVCNIGDDGAFTQEQFSAFWNDCNQELPASPVKMLFMGFLSSVGKEGLNAMAASGKNADGDCTDCDCLSCSEHFTVAEGFGTLDSRGDNYIIASSSFHTSPFNYNMLRIISDLPPDGCCTIVSYEVLSGNAGTVSAGNNPFPAAQTTLLNLPHDYCWMQFETDTGESPFQVKITFLA